MTGKDRKIIEDAERDGIPIFVFTAKDELMVRAIEKYRVDCINFGCTRKHIEEVTARAKELAEWQYRNIHLIKLPD